MPNGSSTKDVESMLLALIPDDMKADGLVSNDMIKIGVIDMATALNLDDVTMNDTVDEDGEVVETIISPTLTVRQLRLAAYFSYGLYLSKLKLLLTNDAINFSTLTFSIKGLEKRPESIGDEIYRNNRYLQDEINRINGSSSGILGTAVAYGG